MLTDPKSGDYLAWFFCTKEQTRHQIAYFLRQQPERDFRNRETEDDDLSFVEISEILPECLHLDCTSAAKDKPDIVQLIKRARVRTDQALPVLRGGDVAKNRRLKLGYNSIETFVAGIAHHFNNLFMEIQGNVSLILAGKGRDHRHYRRFKRIEKLILGESMLTNDLLGIVIEKECRIDSHFQAHLLDEIMAIADTLAMRRAFCNEEASSRRKAQRSRQALRQFSSGVACILNRLLNEINAHTAFIMADGGEDPVEDARLYKITKIIMRGRKLLRDLADTAGRRPASGGRVDVKTLKQLLNRLVHNCRQDIRWHLEVDPDAGAIAAASSRIASILAKLYANAAEAMPEGGEIRVTVGRRERGRGKRSTMRVTFEDTGQGMAPEVTRRIFDPFFTTRSPQNRRGLGLSGAEGLVLAVGGRIRVRSRPGAGTTFTIDLPVADEKGALPIPDAA